jgi:KDO II ethanolaminephosphotransferase
MTFMNVVIGYGIIASVMTTDIDLSKEVVGLHFILWLVSAPCRCCLSGATAAAIRLFTRCARQDSDPKRRRGAAGRPDGLGADSPAGSEAKNDERTSGVDMPSYGGVVANSYLPSNWISALGLYAWAQVDES